MKFRPAFPAAAALAVSSLIVVVSGCNKKAAPTATTAPVVAAPTPPPIDYATVRPDELGQIPVVMYHDIGAKGPYKKDGLNIAPETFRQQLQLLYDNGFHPINLSDVVNDRIDVPAGKSPVVLTFDDARQTQFKLNDQGDSLKIDPNCAVGILEAFVKAHPDWKLRATFFVLPKSRVTAESFGQTGLGAQKISYLLQNGMEVANHSTVHRSFSRYTAADIQRELGGAQNAVQAQVPEAKMETVALPMGIYPRDKNLWKFLLEGEFEGKSYRYKAAMMAAWRPIPSPSSLEFKPLRLERISPIDGVNGLQFWVKKLSLGGKYVSDGDPETISFPAGEEKRVATDRLTAAGKRMNPYQVSGGGAKPIVSDSAPGTSTPANNAVPPPGPKPIVGG